MNLPVSYERLRGFHEGVPLSDSKGRPSLWETVVYEQTEMAELNEDLKHIYALLKVAGDSSILQHLYIDRIDFCTFGNSMPFRIRIVNAYNDNQDYFYVKKADASRVYGLELEHLLSPNRLNFLISGSSLIEEHIPGIPGDVFISQWLDRGDLKPVRVAKELVKFNERCFIRLLGDMRAYNFVCVVTPDFEDAQLRIRAMDFDQQSYNGRKNFYLPQFFPENRELSLYCTRHLHPNVAFQYQREEQTLMLQRSNLAAERLGRLLNEMANDPIAPTDKVHTLRASLAEHYKRNDYLRCESMGELIRENLESVRRLVARDPVQPPA
jgi:Txe/YoeB family toxin of Txe-Axe toxin-antitoxin module